MTSNGIGLLGKRLHERTGSSDRRFTVGLAPGWGDVRRLGLLCGDASETETQCLRGACLVPDGPAAGIQHSSHQYRRSKMARANLDSLWWITRDGKSSCSMHADSETPVVQPGIVIGQRPSGRWLRGRNQPVVLDLPPMLELVGRCEILGRRLFFVTIQQLALIP